MKIPNLENLPALTTRAGWAKAIDCNQSTLYRAEMQKKLKRANPGSWHAIYTRDAVLAWLGLSK